MYLISSSLLYISCKVLLLLLSRLTVMRRMAKSYIVHTSNKQFHPFSPPFSLWIIIIWWLSVIFKNIFLEYLSPICSCVLCDFLISFQVLDLCYISRYATQHTHVCIRITSIDLPWQQTSSTQVYSTKNLKSSNKI